MEGKQKSEMSWRHPQLLVLSEHHVDAEFEAFRCFRKRPTLQLSRSSLQRSEALIANTANSTFPCAVRLKHNIWKISWP